jgi:hypothetical protein
MVGGVVERYDAVLIRDNEGQTAHPALRSCAREGDNTNVIIGEASPQSKLGVADEQALPATNQR